MLPAVVVMSAMGALLLLIVCANVAGLVLVRGVSRRGELAMRLALGATRAAMLRLLLVENLVLAVPGAAAGPRAGVVRPAVPVFEHQRRRGAPGSCSSTSRSIAT